MATAVKLNLLRATAEKLKDDKLFLAFHLQQYLVLKDQSAEALQDLLGCGTENYYKLCLARLPEKDPDYDLRLAAIAEFAKADLSVLKAVLDLVSEQNESQQTLEQQLFSSFRNLPLFRHAQRIEQRTIRLSKRVPRPVFRAAAAILLLFTLIRVQMAGVDDKALRSASIDFRDSLSHLAIQDNTAVQSPFIQHT